MKRTLPAVLGILLLSTRLAALASPNFISVGAMTSPRQEHTATLLTNGKVLVAAGSLNNNYTSLSGADLFNPANGLWRNTGSLNTSRMRQTATLLPNGKVLVTGGDNIPAGGGPVSSAELYDPATETWTNTGSLNIGRELHTATLLSNGKVLVVGGHGSDNLASAELYDPATGTWTNTGSLNAARFHHTATLLPNGKVLVTGGTIYNGGFNTALSSAELYDPATERWTFTYPMSTNRSGHTATLLPSGKVLVAGGSDWNNSFSSAELYDPATELWTPTGSLNATNGYETATLLANGKVLVAGGGDSSSAELYDPTNGTWMQIGTMNADRGYGVTATLLANGRVLFVGGLGTNDTLSSAELFDSTIAIVTLGNLNQIYDGTAKSVSVTTVPAGLTVNLTYSGSANAPTNVGNYTVIGTVNDAYYAGSATNTLAINNKTTATVTLGNLSQTCDGTAKTVSVTTDPPGLTVDLTYNGSADVPINACSYTVIGTINDATYAGSATNTLVIDKNPTTVTLGNLNQIFDGTAKIVSVTTVPAGLTVNLTYNGSANAPTNVGNYTVIGTVNDAYYAGSATNTLAINNKTTATVTLGNLSQTCDGTAKTVSVTTDPPGLTVDLTYNGSADVPINAGSYTVIGTINDATWAGSATNMLVIHNIADFFTYLTNNSAITITGYTGLGGNVIIPSIINGLPVTIIGKSAFSNCYGLTGVVIPTSVISIDDEAFNQCYSLNNVIIPNSVVSIGKAAFDGCLSLTNITISASVTSVGDSAFINCTSLTGIMLPSSITNIGRWAFAATSISRIDVDAANANYSSVNGVVFNKDQTTIVIFPSGRSGSYAIPTTVTNIGEEAFYFCTSLTGVTIPSSVTSIGSGAFQYCYDLTSIAIPSSITSIADGAFGYCTNLTSVVIPASVTSIGNFAFGDCTSLVHITIPGNITNIGWSAFYNCINLTGVYFSGNAPSVGSGVFDGDNYATVYYLAQTTSWGATLGGRPTALWPAPALGISTYNSQPTVFFPTATGTNFVLQMTTNLASGNWVTISNGIPISGIIVTNPPGTAFFRLH